MNCNFLLTAQFSEYIFGSLDLFWSTVNIANFYFCKLTNEYNQFLVDSSGIFDKKIEQETNVHPDIFYCILETVNFYLRLNSIDLNFIFEINFGWFNFKDDFLSS